MTELLLAIWDMLRTGPLHIVLEIAIIAWLIYLLLRVLRGTRAIYILIGLVILMFLIGFVAHVMNFGIIERLLEEARMGLILGLLVLFQPELRRALAQLGSYSFWHGKQQRETIGETVSAAIEMSRRKCGALIVFERRISLNSLEEDTVRLDCKVNSMLLQSIFFPRSPLHDGAVLIRDNRIVAARVILPLPRGKISLNTRIGTRHRAAIGITEETDAVVLVVSEETGVISIATGGLLKRDLLPDQLEEVLRRLIINDRPEENDFDADPMRDSLKGGGK
ncbi:MAG: diadenylate cyclase CdaA [Lentisphaeria bacterium]|nr:diadenylate cyclase CdaA [Lentisphaeria bacterium]